MADYEFKAKTVEMAIEQGLQTLGLTKEEVQIKVLDEGRAGLFGLMGASPARVLIIPLRGAKPSDHGLQAVQSGKDLQESSVSTIEGVVKDIMKHMNINASVSTERQNSHIVVQVSSDKNGLLIGKGGQTLDALEYLSNLVASRILKEHVRFNVDIAQYRANRDAKLKELARQYAQECLTSGKSVALKPMSSEERKIIHLELKGMQGISTESSGHGEMRHVVIKPQSD